MTCTLGLLQGKSALPRICRKCLRRLGSHTAKIGVIGLWLPRLLLSLLVSEAGFEVMGSDIDAKKSLRVASSHPCLRFLGIMMVVLFGSAGQAYSQCSNPANPIVAE